MQRPSREIVEWLGRAQSGPAMLGGKAASLDRLARMGFRIPPGFCLTTAAFRLQVAAMPAPALTLAGAGAGPSTPTALSALIATAPLTPGVAGPLSDAIEQLVELSDPNGSADHSPPTFAVRSSAIGEDGTEASYAGLHETELGVAPDEISAAVRRCWASLWSVPAMAYRTRRGLPSDDAAMAVVVQALVPADAAIVAFTRHPVTGRTDQLVVTAVRGLGDAMVSGTVTPDTFVIDRATLAVASYTPGDSGTGPALDDASVRELASLCLDVEARFGQPVDIEAAVRDGTWYLLQARPITTA